MIKREFKVNLKGFIIWLGILVIIFGFVYAIYPFILNDETMKNMEEVMKTMPPEFLKVFNMDMSSISSAYGWLKSEGFMFVLLIIGFYSSYLGGTILLKEESDRTIEYVNSLPIKRSRVVTNKVLVGITYVIAIVISLAIINYLALLLFGDFDHNQYILLSITPLFIGLPLFAISLFISTFMHKSKKMIGISLGIVFISYIINVLSELSEKVEAIKYISIYTLADIRSVITDITINPIMVLISLGITVVFIALSYIRYNKKELV